MNKDRYLDVLNANIGAVEKGESPEELMPLLQWLRHWRPASDDDNNVDYMTTSEIRSTMSELVTLDLNLISTIMWRLGYEVSVAALHPAWAMIMV